jgi:hypothetical protein
MQGVLVVSSGPTSDFPPPPPPAALPPPCLFHWNNQVLLYRAIDHLRAADLHSLRIVTGYRADLIEEHLGEVAPGLPVEVVHNPAWANDSVGSIERGLAGIPNTVRVIVGGRWEADIADPPAIKLTRRQMGSYQHPGSDAYAVAALRRVASVVDTGLAQSYAESDEARLAAYIPAAWRRTRVRADCTRATKRCEYWNWGPDAPRPPCCTRHLRYLLAFTDDLLTRHGIPHWLDYGPLLGAVREGRLIPWDYDVDFGVMLTDRGRIAGLRAEIEQAGHWLDMGDDHMWRVVLSRDNGLHADLFPWHREDGLLKLSGPFAGAGAFPPEWLERLAPVRLLGHEHRAPAPFEEFLERYRYGADWRTPIRFSDDAVGPAAAAEHFVARLNHRRQFRANLRRLHDTLASTVLDQHYWLWGGQLIGAFRERDIVAHDDQDADFALLRRDLAFWPEAAAALIADGFEPRFVYRNHEGQVVEYQFRKDGAGFDFFIVDEIDGQFRSFCFGRGREFESRLAAHGWDQQSWLDRHWRVPHDAEGVLTAIYGDWRRPQPDYDYTRDDRTLVAARAWPRGAPDPWTGPPA